MLKEIAEGTQIPKPEEDALNYSNKTPLQLQNNYLLANNQVIFNSYHMEEII